MDNILKLLLGVLGVAALITFVTANLTFDSEPVTVAQTAPAASVAPPANEGNTDVSAEESFDEGSPEEDGEDMLAVGDPVIDGNPYGSSMQQQQNLQNEVQIPQEQAPNAPYNYAQPAMPNYTVPQVNSQPQNPADFAQGNGGQ